MTKIILAEIILALVGVVTNNSIEKMKKSFIFVALATVIAMCATSCKKDESVLKFTATIERGDSKTTLDEWADSQRQVVWSEGDKIKVWGFGPGEDPTYANLGYVCNLTNGTGSISAEFEVDPNDPNVDRLAESARFTAAYPVDAWTHSDQVYINSDQTFIPGNVLQYPMMAVSNNTHLQFKNVCGIIEVKLPRVSGIRLSGMKIEADHQISGDYSVDWNNGNPTLTPISGLTEIEVSFPQVIDLSTETRPSVLVYLPAGDHPGINIEFYTTDFTYTKITAQANQSINVNRSKITTLDFHEAVIPPAQWRPLPIHRNYFSVSDDLQVDIANGNLVYGTGGNWFIAQNAWDVYGNFDNFKDYFYWDDGDNDGGITFPSTENFSFQDWGYHVTPNVSNYSEYQAIATRWRTLTADEWNYLTNWNSDENSIRAGKCYFVWVSDMYFTDIHRHEFNLGGILLMPDDWESLQDRPTITNAQVSDWGNALECVLTGNELKLFLEKGCAFIPNNGFSVEDDPIDLHTGGNATWVAYYHLAYPDALNFESSWHTTNGPGEEHEAYGYTFKNTVDGIWHNDLHNRHGVRLVRNAKYYDDGDNTWHYYTGFEPNQNTASKGKRK